MSLSLASLSFVELAWFRTPFVLRNLMVVITTNGGLQPWAIQGSLLRALKDVPAVSHSRGEIAGAVSFLGLGTANIRRLHFQVTGF